MATLSLIDAGSPVLANPDKAGKFPPVETDFRTISGSSVFMVVTNSVVVWCSLDTNSGDAAKNSMVKSALLVLCVLVTDVRDGLGTLTVLERKLVDED